MFSQIFFLSLSLVRICSYFCSFLSACCLSKDSLKCTILLPQPPTECLSEGVTGVHHQNNHTVSTGSLAVNILSKNWYLSALWGNPQGSLISPRPTSSFPH